MHRIPKLFEHPRRIGEQEEESKTKVDYEEGKLVEKFSHFFLWQSAQDALLFIYFIGRDSNRRH